MDRYSVSGVKSTGAGLQTFTNKIDNGIGVEKTWGDHWVSRLDGSMVYPNLNPNNSIKSGVEAGVEIEYQWKKWLANYRVNYLNLNNESGRDSAYFQALRLGYRF